MATSTPPGPVRTLANVPCQTCLLGVVDLSPTDAWAVGRTDTPHSHGLILHWDGATWSPSTLPADSTHVVLYDVAADAANDVWAVGRTPHCCGFQTVTLHWDGSRWSHVPSPSPSSGWNELRSVTVLSPTDAWAVGRYNTNVLRHTLILHWDGASWSQVPSPDPDKEYDALLGVDAASTNDVWAVGYAGAAFFRSFVVGTPHTLILHWDGTRWSRVPAPNPPPYGGVFMQVAAEASDDVWAVGFAGPRTLVAHWNGAEWSRVSSPNPGSGANILDSVSATSPEDAWAVGYHCGTSCGFDTRDQRALILHWNGTTWTRTPSPVPGHSRHILSDVSVGSATDAWAVGFSGQLILHWNGSNWSV